MPFFHPAGVYSHLWHIHRVINDFLKILTHMSSRQFNIPDYYK